MSVFDQLFGSQGAVNNLACVNGMSNIHEKDNVLTFSIIPTHKADSVSIENIDGRFNITLYKRGMPYQYFQQVEHEHVREVLEAGTDVLF